MKDLLKRLGTFSTSVLFISMISIAAYALTPTAFWKKICDIPWRLADATKETESPLIGRESSARDLHFSTDGTKLYTIGTSNDTIHQYSLSTAWDISTATYNENNLNVSSEEGFPHDLFFKSDGTKLYVIGSNTDSVHQYSLATAWDVSTATYDSVSFSVSSEEVSPTGLFFKSDGTKLYVSGSSTNSVHQYSLATAWDVSTATYDSVSFSVSTEAGTPEGLFLKSDGTKLYVIDSSNDYVYQYSLSTAWDASTATYDSVSFSVSNEESIPGGLFFKPDGTEVYIIGRISNHVYKYKLAGAWDISESGNKLNLAKEDKFVDDLFFKPDGTKFYVIGSGNDRIYQYSVSTAWDISTATYDDISFSVSSEDYNAKDLYIKSDGTKLYIIGLSNDSIHQYSLSTAWDISTATYDGLSFSIASEETQPQDLFFKPDGSKFYVTGSSSDSIHQYTLSTAWDLSTATYDSLSFSVSSEEITPNGSFFKSDGAKLYVIGSNSDSVHQYSLSTAWDISTTSYDAVSFSVSTEDGMAEGLFFKSDGLKLYMIGNNNDNIYQYSLTTAWDASTITYDNLNYDVGGVAQSPEGVFLKDDGTKLYVIGDTYDKIHQYSLTTAWDISTAIYDDISLDISSEDGWSEDLYIKADGTKLYVIGSSSDSVHQYTLSTAWDLSTATYDGVSFSVSVEDGRPRGLFFKSDGTKLYVLGADNDSIFQYSLSTAWDISTAAYDSISYNTAAEDTFETSLSFSSDGTKFYMLGSSYPDTIYQYTLSTAWDISTAAYDNISFAVQDQQTIGTGIYLNPNGNKLYVTGQSPASVHEYYLSSNVDISTAEFVLSLNAEGIETVPSGLTFKLDGTKLYVIGSSSDSIHQYTLSTAWDVSTATYDNISFSISTEEYSPADLFFKSDGTKLYIIGSSSDSVYQYSLSTAWDLSTATYDSVSFSVSTEDNIPGGIHFKSDGTKLYMIGWGNDFIHQYTLSTPWDVSTATYDSVSLSVSTEESTPQGLFFKPDGTRIYIIGQTGDEINQYKLTTAWDLSTAVFDNITYSVASEDATPLGLYLKDDGTKLYIIGSVSDRVHQYSLQITCN